MNTLPPLPVAFVNMVQPMNDDRDYYDGWNACHAAFTSAIAAQAQPADEPVLYQVRMRPMWREEGKGWTPWDAIFKEDCSAYEKLPIYNDWQRETRALYTHPAAVQPV